MVGAGPLRQIQVDGVRVPCSLTVLVYSGPAEGQGCWDTNIPAPVGWHSTAVRRGQSGHR